MDLPLGAAVFAGLLGEANVLVSAQDQAPFLTDWLGKYRGAARAVPAPRGPRRLDE